MTSDFSQSPDLIAIPDEAVVPGCKRTTEISVSAPQN